MSENINGNVMIDWFEVLFCQYLFTFYIFQNCHLLNSYLVGDIVKAFSPASALIPSNSRGLKIGL